MKLFDKAISIINKLEEGVGEVPPQVPSPGNVSYYQSVDETETEGEWGPWQYNKSDDSWSVSDLSLSQLKKDPWGREIRNVEKTWWDEMKDSENELIGWKFNRKAPNGKIYQMIVRND